MTDRPDIQPTPQDTYTASDIAAVLAELPKDTADAINSRLHERSSANATRAKIQEVQLHVANLAIAAHQTFQAEAPNDLDPIFWDRATRDNSETLLAVAGEVDNDARNAIPKSATDFAAAFFVQREASFGAAEEELSGLLEPAGLALPNVHDQLATILFESGQFDGYSSVDELKEDVGDIYVLSQNFDDQLLAPLAGSFREDLKQQGYRLPELGPDHTYGYDEAEEEYIYPKVSIELIPTEPS